MKPLYAGALRGCMLVLAIAVTSGARAEETQIKLDDTAKAQLLELSSLLPSSLEAPALEGKPVIVTFFASWCPPCREEFKQLNQLISETESGSVTVLAVNVFEDWFGIDEARLKKFLELYAPQFHVLEGNDAIKQTFGDVNRIPTLYVFDQRGDLRESFVHAKGAAKRHATAEELHSMLQNL